MGAILDLHEADRSLFTIEELQTEMLDRLRAPAAKSNGAPWRGLMRLCGLEDSLTKLGIKHEQLPSIVEACDKDRLSNHPVTIDKTKLLTLLQRS